MKSNFPVWLFIFNLALVCGCKARSTDSDPKFAQNHSMFLGGRGHEDLIRLGIANANPWIRDYLKNDDVLFPEVQPNQIAQDSSNQIVLGSLATDLPSQKPDFLIKLNDFYELTPPDNLWDSTQFEHLHFMRSWTATSYVSSSDACRISKEHIISRTIDGLKIWNSDREKALFFIGHALHAVQDSFSLAHTQRSPNGQDILDICIWKKPVPGICFHSEPDTRDLIWNGVACVNSGRFDCMKPEAKLAVNVSADFLKSVARAQHLGGTEAIVRRELTRFFEDRSDPAYYFGYFQCNHLQVL